MKTSGISPDAPSCGVSPVVGSLFGIEAAVIFVFSAEVLLRDLRIHHVSWCYELKITSFTCCQHRYVIAVDENLETTFG